LYAFVCTFLYADYDDDSILPTPIKNNYKLPYSGPINKPQLIWKFKTSSSAIESIVTIDKNGTLYFGSNDNYVYALDSLTGNLIWKFKTKYDVKSSVIINKQGDLLFGSMDGYLYSLNKNGTLKWKYNAHSAISSTPNIDKENNIIFGDKKGYFHILDSDGDLIHKFRLTTSIKNTPIVDQNNNFYLGFERGIISFKKNGTINWHYKTRSAITSSLVLFNNTIFASSKDWKLYALSLNGKLQWTYQTAWYVTSSPVVGSDTIYLGSWDWSVHAISLVNGEGIWKTQPERSATMTYFAANMIVDENENIYAASRNDRIYCFDKRGKVLWHIVLKGEDVLGGISLHKNGTLIIPTSKGNIYAFKTKVTPN